MNILVTGGAGYIGSNTVNTLIGKGYNVTIVDDLSCGSKNAIHPEALFVQASVLNTEVMTRLMIEKKIEGVIHFAANIIVPESIVQSLNYYENNTFGVISTLKACKLANVTNFVFSSTAAVYGNAGNELIAETSTLGPLNPYGFSKLFSEQIIRDCEKEFGLRSVIFRYFNVAGASSNLQFGQRSKVSTHLIKIASETACGKRPSMSITGTDFNTKDGTGVRDYIHVEDLADAHVLALEYLVNGGKSDIFNCGYGHGYSVLEVVDCVRRVSGVNLVAHTAPRRGGDADSLVSNSAKLKQRLNWQPKRDNLDIICQSAYQFERTLS